jgi:hypothetical protein
MDVVGQLNAEFETLGEAAVSERLSTNYYTGSARAVAIRWLNEKACARVGIDHPVHGLPLELGSHRTIRAENIGRLAILCGVVALLASVGSLGLSVKTLQDVHALRLTVQSISAPVAPPAVAPSH